MIRREYLVIGAGVGGASVCQALRTYEPTASVMLVGSEGHPAYARPDLLRLGLDPQAPLAEPPYFLVPGHLESLGIDVRLNTLVSDLNLDRRIAVLSTGQAVGFRKACLAMGSHPLVPKVAGARLGNVLYFHGWRDLLALRELIENERDALIVGGGCIASQVAGYLKRFPALKVRLLHRKRWLLDGRLDAATAQWLTEYYRQHGVELSMNETLNGFEGHTVLKNVQTKSGQRYSVGFTLVALGTEPNLNLVLQTPLAYPQGTPVNDFLETDERGIYAIGGIAAYPDRIFGGIRREDDPECVMVQGQIAAGNMSGKRRHKFEWVPRRTMLLLDLNFELLGDFSHPVTRVDLEGDLESRQFTLRYFQGPALGAIILCRPAPGQVEAARAELRAWPRESKRRVA